MLMVKHLCYSTTSQAILYIETWNMHMKWTSWHQLQTPRKWGLGRFWQQPLFCIDRYTGQQYSPEGGEQCFTVIMQHRVTGSQLSNLDNVVMSSNRGDLENVNPVFWMASHFVPLVKEGEMREKDTDDDILNQGFCEAPLPKVGDFIITSFHIGRRLVHTMHLLFRLRIIVWNYRKESL